MTDEAPIDQGNPWDKVREMSQQREKLRAELAQLRADNASTLEYARKTRVALEEAAAENARLRTQLESLTRDPPATLDEPDTDAEVITKMRAIARAALTDIKP